MAFDLSSFMQKVENRKKTLLTRLKDLEITPEQLAHLNQPLYDEGTPQNSIIDVDAQTNRRFLKALKSAGIVTLLDLACTQFNELKEFGSFDKSQHEPFKKHVKEKGGFYHDDFEKDPTFAFIKNQVARHNSDSASKVSNTGADKPAAAKVLQSPTQQTTSKEHEKHEVWEVINKGMETKEMDLQILAEITQIPLRTLKKSKFAKTTSEKAENALTKEQVLTIFYNLDIDEKELPPSYIDDIKKPDKDEEDTSNLRNDEIWTVINSLLQEHQMSLQDLSDLTNIDLAILEQSSAAQTEEDQATHVLSKKNALIILGVFGKEKEGLPVSYGGTAVVTVKTETQEQDIPPQEEKDAPPVLDEKVTQETKIVKPDDAPPPPPEPIADPRLAKYAIWPIIDKAMEGKFVNGKPMNLTNIGSKEECGYHFATLYKSRSSKTDDEKRTNALSLNVAVAVFNYLKISLEELPEVYKQEKIARDGYLIKPVTPVIPASPDAGGNDDKKLEDNNNGGGGSPNNDINDDEKDNTMQQNENPEYFKMKIAKFETGSSASIPYRLQKAGIVTFADAAEKTEQELLEITKAYPKNHAIFMKGMRTVGFTLKGDSEEVKSEMHKNGNAFFPQYDEKKKGKYNVSDDTDNGAEQNNGAEQKLDTYAPAIYKEIGQMFKDNKDLVEVQMIDLVEEEKIKKDTVLAEIANNPETYDCFYLIEFATKPKTYWTEKGLDESKVSQLDTELEPFKLKLGIYEETREKLVEQDQIKQKREAIKQKGSERRDHLKGLLGLKPPGE